MPFEDLSVDQPPQRAPRHPPAGLVDQEIFAARAGEVVERGGAARMCVERHVVRGTRRPEGLPRRVVVLEMTGAARRGEVHTTQPRLPCPFEFAHRGTDVPHGQVGQADVTLGLDGHEIGEPSVVDLVADGAEFERTRRHGAEPASGVGDQRHRFAVLAELVDHFCCDAIAVHIAQARVDVVVAVDGDVGMTGGEARPLVDDAGARHVGAARFVGSDESVEIGQVLLWAVRTQILAQAWADVAVARDDDDRIGQW